MIFFLPFGCASRSDFRSVFVQKTTHTQPRSKPTQSRWQTITWQTSSKSFLVVMAAQRARESHRRIKYSTNCLHTCTRRTKHWTHGIINALCVAHGCVVVRTSSAIYSYLIFGCDSLAAGSSWCAVRRCETKGRNDKTKIVIKAGIWNCYTVS